MKTNIKLPLTDFEKANLKKNKVRILEILNYTTDELEVLLNSTTERAKEIHALAEFQTVPSIGMKFAEDLVFLGYYSLNELKNKDGRVSQSGFMFAGGIHFRMIPVAYKFDIDYDDFTGGGPSISNFGKKNSSLSNGHFYFPIQAGYTFKKKIGNPIAIGWEPSVMAGISLSRLQSSGLTSGYSYLDDSNVRHRLQEITSYYSELNPWLTYTLNARASKTLRRGNQIFFGINFNYSPVIYNSGQYSYYPNSGKQTGTFSDTGSYLALQFGFSFVRKYQEPQTYSR